MSPLCHCSVILCLAFAPCGIAAAVVAKMAYGETADKESIAEFERRLAAQKERNMKLAPDQRSSDGVHPLEFKNEWVSLELVLPGGGSTPAKGALWAKQRRRGAHVDFRPAGYGSCPGTECNFYVEYVARRRGVPATVWDLDQYRFKTSASNKYLFVESLDSSPSNNAYLRFGTSCTNHDHCAFTIEATQGSYKIEAISTRRRWARRRDGRPTLSYYGPLTVLNFNNLAANQPNRRRDNWMRWKRCHPAGSTCLCDNADEACLIGINVIRRRRSSLLQSNDSETHVDSVYEGSAAEDDTEDSHQYYQNREADDTAELEPEAKRSSIMRSEKN